MVEVLVKFNALWKVLELGLLAELQINPEEIKKFTLKRFTFAEILENVRFAVCWKSITA